MRLIRELALVAAIASAPIASAVAISEADQDRLAALLAQAEDISAGKTVGELLLDPREFSSGSFGWFASEKVAIPVGKDRVRCQLSINVTVIGSKNSR